jgi:phosphohistidine phosphatase
MALMRRLILFRHAKSSWDDPALDDHDRPLAPRGLAAAPRMGAWLAERGYAPDAVLTSTSARTLQTWDLARQALADPPDPVVTSRLYHADPATMLEVLRRAPAAAATVAIIGHQPGISGFARKLSDGRAAPSCARAFKHFPTAAIAVLDFDAPDWASVDWGTGRFHAFATPRELA